MKGRLLPILILILVIAGVWLALNYFGALETLVARESALRHLVANWPVASFVVGFCLYLLASLVPGTTGKAVVYGWLFGFWTGLVIVSLALALAAVIVCLVVRVLMQDVVHQRFETWIVRLNKGLAREGALYLVTLRLMHAPYSLTNYAAGATSVKLRTLGWTTLLGMLPGNIAFVLAGTHIPTLRTVVDDGPWSLIDVRLFAALSLLVLAPLAARWLVRFWRADEAEA
ncbi:MAG: VTT domain-containing protein [Pirellulales bacterium]